MTWTYSDEYYRQYTKDTWNESAAAYEPLEKILDAWNPDILRLAAPKPGERVLDIATGRGEPALSLARATRPGGRVLGIDLAERMVELATERAKRVGVENATFAMMDAENLDVPRASFDLATCRFGLQIVTNPQKAIEQAYHALRPGGRFVASVWGPGERNPHIHAIIAPMLEFAEPDETGYLPTPYEMGGEGELAGILRKVGFKDVHDERVTHPVAWGTEDAYFRLILDGTPIGHSLHEEDEDVQREVLAKTRENLKAWRRSDGTHSATGEAVLVRGVKPPA